MKKRVIFDLDNCISNDWWRVSMIRWNTSVEHGRYSHYHMQAPNDKPCNVDVVEHHLASGHELIFLTARPRMHYVATCEWLAKHFELDDKSTYTLLMREDHDHRHSVQVKEDMLYTLEHFNIPLSSIVAAYDDRQDIVDMYVRRGIAGATRLAIHSLDAFNPPPPPPPTTPEITMITPAQPTAADILAEAAETFRQRNAVYGSNFEMVGPIMKILFPKGLTPELLGCPQYHLLELIVVKLSRFAISDMKHQDSIHDSCVYAALIESIVREQQNG